MPHLSFLASTSTQPNIPNSTLFLYCSISLKSTSALISSTSCIISFYEPTFYRYAYKYFLHVSLYAILDIKVVSVLTLLSHSSQFSSTHTNSSRTSPPSPKAIYAKYSLTLVKANINLIAHLDVSYAEPTLLLHAYPLAYFNPSYAEVPLLPFADPHSSRPSPNSYADSILNRVTTPEPVSTGGNYCRTSNYTLFSLLRVGRILTEYQGSH